MNKLTTLLWAFLMLICLSCEQDELIGFPGHEKTVSMEDVCHLSGRGVPPVTIDTCSGYFATTRLKRAYQKTSIDSIWLMTTPEIEALYQTGTNFITIGNAPQLLYGESQIMKMGNLPTGSEYAWEFDFYTAENQFLQWLIGALGGMSHLNSLNGVQVDGWTATYNVNNSYLETTIYIQNQPPQFYNWGQVLWFGNDQIFLIRRVDLMQNAIWWTVIKKF